MNLEKLDASVTDAPYQTDDSDLIDLEKNYSQFEDNLKLNLENIEKIFRGYQSYSYDVDKIGHDPYVLMAIMSAIKPKFKLDDKEVVETLAWLKKPRRHYTLTLQEVNDANEIINQAVYDNITSLSDLKLSPANDRKQFKLKVTLINYGLNCVIDSLLTYDQTCNYAAYLRSHGNRPDLFPKSKYPNATELPQPNKYKVSEDLLAKYPHLARLLPVAEKFLGYPYVWSGYQPETSFDCSGFIEYCMNEVGWNIERVTVQGLYEYCQPIKDSDARPGDLVFFTGTFRANRMTHVGIYVGDSTMLHCTAPCVKYSHFSDQRVHSDERWSANLAGFARLP